MIKIPELIPTQLEADQEKHASIAGTTCTQLIIQVPDSLGVYHPVGAIKGFHVTQTRPVRHEEIVHEDGTVEYKIVPGPVETTINLQRTVFDSLGLPEAFGCGFRSIQSQSIPFDIRVIESYGNCEIISTYHNCWFTAMNTPVKADNYIILEQATLVCERISTQRK